MNFIYEKTTLKGYNETFILSEQYVSITIQNMCMKKLPHIQRVSEKVSAQYINEIEMAKAQRDFELKKAIYDLEVNTRKAESDLAFQLQVAKTKQKIEEQKVQVQVVERTQQIQLQDQEIMRKEKELEARIKKPADAERYRLEKLAEAERMKLITEAEAEAESIRVKGEAQAYAIEVRARADAEQMEKKAQAFQQYQEAAIVDMLMEKLPLIVDEISKPLTKVNKIKMVSSSGTEVGAAKITGEVLDILNRLPETVEKLTGININYAEETWTHVLTLEGQSVPLYRHPTLLSLLEDSELDTGIWVFPAEQSLYRTAVITVSRVTSTPFLACLCFLCASPQHGCFC
ncbi:hypothetical protein AB205_0016630 [Aquarana catesbeiana]|uniref:Flotillin n=1 Tax=Aquarana catesbeiana TaxID=8400 RepID=A0A2G9SIL5_AQUCT|nr:hypothetical protein AB205_0016630 [Aquarana catesbeiana]